MRLAVIPARGGSKRIPRKNIKAFCGRPIIGWSIEAARSSGLFERVIVSTEDAEIARLASTCGAEVPFERPAALADDFATTSDVMAHAARWASEQAEAPKMICCLYPAAPLIQARDLIAAASMLESGTWDYVFSAAEHPAPVFRAFRASPDGGVELFFPEYSTTRSQDLPAAYYDAGQFYCGTAEAWLERRPIFGGRSRMLVLPAERVQDIDTPADWSRAEMLFTFLKDAQG